MNAPAAWEGYTFDADHWVFAYFVLCDSFAFPPLLFAAAHALELYLKAVCKKADPAFFPPASSHKLWNLWEKAGADSFSGFTLDPILRNVDMLSGRLTPQQTAARDVFPDLYLALTAITDLKYASGDWLQPKEEGVGVS
ncbi:MAG: hypothetical protein P4L92_00440 [Rudaea sp.]|nr:hypothetical protein [Rudaea sp.]